MRILMLGNSLTFANDMPQMLAALTGAEVVHHTRGRARLSEQLNPATRLGAQTQAALAGEHWDYVVLQEMSHGPISSPKSFQGKKRETDQKIEEIIGLDSVQFTQIAMIAQGQFTELLNAPGERRSAGPLCHLGLPKGQRQTCRQGLGLR